MVLRNQQADAQNFVKLFHEKSPLLRGTSSYKRGLDPIISPRSRKRGVQITLNPPQTALTSMLETVKIGGMGNPGKARCHAVFTAWHLNLFVNLVRPTGFEPAAYRVGVCHSIQLSYGRVYALVGHSTLGIIAVLPADVKPFSKKFFAERLLKKLTTRLTCCKIATRFRCFAPYSSPKRVSI